MKRIEHIRNFSIIAHIDHGKSTLADRLLELTHTIEMSKMQKQVLDDMPLEQERGITIKAHAIRMKYRAADKQDYILNLIDTPGHVDFSYEVSRSIAACEGALLVVDASQGIEAQTLSNLYKALDANLEIIPVINKIDLPHAEPEKVAESICNLIGCPREEIILVSAKKGIGIEAVLEAIVTRIPPPLANPQWPLKAMIFDSKFDSYRGAVPYVRLMDGEVKKGDRIKFFSTGIQYEVDEVGYLIMDRIPADKLSAGEVGYIVCNIRTVADAKVGDTITYAVGGCIAPCPGYKEIKSMVYSGIYPAATERYEQLREALEKLKLNDASLTFEPESSLALGFGFRCGFLGLLHLEIIHERLEREFNCTIVNTVPNVEYHVHTHKGELVKVDNPAKMPPPGSVEYIEEPYVAAQIITPVDYIGNIMKLISDRRGEFKDTHYPDTSRATIDFQSAAFRNHFRFPRQAQVDFARLRIAGLRLPRHAPEQAGQTRHPAQLRAGRCALVPDSSGTRRGLGAQTLSQTAGTDTAADVRGRHSGGHRLTHRRARHRPCHAQERHRQMLRRRHHPQTQADRTPERGQDAR